MSYFSRRQLLKTTAIATALAGIPQPLFAMDRQALRIPKLVEIRRGKPLFLGMEEVKSQLMSGKFTEVWGFNGNYLGPTVKIRRGEFVKLNYRNALPQRIAINIQGLQGKGELLSGIARHLKPNEMWSPVLLVDQPAATCWYHSCTLGSSAYQTYRGLAGMWIIEDEESLKANLPQKYGVDDIPLILQDLQLNSEGVQLFRQNQPHFWGDLLFVNGQSSPYINIPRGWIRLRIVNASLSRSYDLRFDDQREFKLLAQDQGFLAKTQLVTSVLLAPSERVELLVNFNEGGNASLIAGHKRNLFDQFLNFFGSTQELVDNVVLELRPEGMTSVFNSPPNTEFATDAATVLATKGMKTRHFHIDTDNATINQLRFDPRRIDVTTKVGTTEHWTLTATQAIGFKIQGAKFVIESINDQPVDDQQKAWKDSLWIDGKVQILVRFEHTSTHNFPFTFGSSDLMLADKGCLGLIVVQ